MNVDAQTANIQHMLLFANQTIDKNQIIKCKKKKHYILKFDETIEKAPKKFGRKNLIYFN